jgi:hypothetical protein
MLSAVFEVTESIRCGRTHGDTGMHRVVIYRSDARTDGGLLITMSAPGRSCAVSWRNVEVEIVLNRNADEACMK